MITKSQSAPLGTLCSLFFFWTRSFKKTSDLTTKIFLWFLLLVPAVLAHGQSVHWASEVIDVSSEFEPEAFSALNALGPPDAVAVGNRKSNVWRPKEVHGESYIIVSFPEKIRINQIAVMETENPGAIASIVAYDENATEYIIYEGSPKHLSAEYHLFHTSFPLTNFEVHSLRINVNGMAIPGYFGIDGIAVANSSEPISISIENDLKRDPNYKLTRLDRMINSKYNEYGPILSLDGNRMYFSRQFDPNNVGGIEDPEDIWFTEWDAEKSEWKPAQNIGSPWNNDGPNFICSIAQVDGREVFLLGNEYKKNGKMLEGISTAEIINGQCTEPTPLKIKRLYNLSDRVDYFLTGNGKVLVISVKRYDAIGERDLYVSFLDEKKNKWSEPRNMGPVINTVKDDESPFVSADENTIYYSSNGFTGYGGLDTYKSSRLDSTWTNWTVPVNMGSNINGPGDEKYMSVFNNNAHIFYTRTNVGGNADIFNINLHPHEVRVTGAVIDGTLNEPIFGAEVVLKSEEKNQYSTITDRQGKFEFNVEINTSWEVAVFKYPHQTNEKIILSVHDQLEHVLDTIYLNAPVPQSALSTTEMKQKLNEGESVILGSIYFNNNSSYLSKEAQIVLQDYAKYLADNPSLKIEINAHTDSKGTAAYNLWLSDRRAMRVKNYLVASGINPDNIAARGFGESKLLSPCDEDVPCSEDAHRQNRRTEIKILK